MKVLQVVNCAYRATTEEQDDTVIWITHAMRGAGAEIDVLLRGNAVGYAVAGQDASGLAIGDWRQTQPPQLDRDISSLLEKGVAVYVAHEDLNDRGIAQNKILGGVQRVPIDRIGQLVDRYDQLWQW